MNLTPFGADDWPVLDSDTCDACALLFKSPFGSVRVVKVEDCDVVDMGMEY